MDGLHKTKELGFDCVDIFQDPLDDNADDRIATVKQTCDELQLPIISVVGVSVGLVDFNPSVQQFHVERCKRYLDMAATRGGHIEIALAAFNVKLLHRWIEVH